MSRPLKCSPGVKIFFARGEGACLPCPGRPFAEQHEGAARRAGLAEPDSPAHVDAPLSSGRGFMSIGAEVAAHLPFLRRYARALTGSQSTGDADRKSTRLNSSHVKISYAVFCLKKKNEHSTAIQRM